MGEPTWLMNDFDFENHMGIGLRTSEKIARAEHAARLDLSARLAASEARAEAAEAEVAKWEALDKTTTSVAGGYLGRAEKAEAALAEARKALEPFAEIADLIETETEGISDYDTFDLMLGGFLMERIGVVDFRRARAALTTAAPGDGT
jgi:hypothetical protein